MTDERRNQTRVPASIEVLWEGNAGKYEARASDLSEGGCFLDTIGHVTLGEKIIFRLRLPDGDPINIEGEVAYAHPSIGFGVRFTNVSESDQKKLDSLIKATANLEDKE
jgi:Tfp pilus assembly protein PilZ